MIVGISKLLNALSMFGAFFTEEVENRAVFDEKLFSVLKRISIGSSATVYIALDFTGFTKNALIFLPPVFEAYGAGPIEIDIFQDPTYTDGTAWIPGNRNMTSQAAAEVEVVYAPTVSDVGTKLDAFEFVIASKSGGTPVTTRLGGVAKDDLIFLPDITKKYLFRMINTEAAACDSAKVAFNWIET